jgi:saccharopine dehydrogenase-like NADP-dependent oxidoreductase
LKHIIVFGAGKSSIYLIDYLIKQLSSNNWQLTVLDADINNARAKTGNSFNADGQAVNVENEIERQKWIASADIVISLLPPYLHYLIAVDCIQHKKNLLTASYVDDKMRALQPEIEKNELFFLCEMGLDPGIDHMSAMRIVHHLHSKGAEIYSFRSHCGGLVAPENDDNPWHYKISWNPRNVVLAGKAGAIFKEDGKKKELSYHELFNPDNVVSVPALGNLAYYANRDSLGYIDIYSLHNAKTFIRTTLRYPEFCSGWKKIIDLGLTSEEITINTARLTLKDFFHRYIKQNISDALFAKQIEWLGFNDDKTFIDKGTCSAADVMQFALEKKLVLKGEDKDMIAMLHEIDYTHEGKNNSINSSLVVRGEDNIKTAMAKTVGLPLAIAAKLILQRKIRLTGLHIPVTAEIYEPVLNELEEHGIRFEETISGGATE